MSNAFTYGKCWNFGKMIKDDMTRTGWTWEQVIESKEWKEFRKNRDFTDTQVFYAKRGFDGLPFEEPDSEKPLDDEIVSFGKHKGQRFRDLKPYYLRWLSEQEWLEKWPTLCLYVQQWKEEEENNKLSKEEIGNILKLD